MESQPAPVLIAGYHTHYKSRLNMLKFHLLDSMVNAMDRFGSLNIPGQFTFEMFNVHMNLRIERHQNDCCL